MAIFNSYVKLPEGMAWNCPSTFPPAEDEATAEPELAKAEAARAAAAAAVKAEQPLG